MNAFRLVGTAGTQYIHVPTSTVIARASPLGVLIDGLDSIKPAGVDLDALDLQAAAEQYLGLLDYKLPMLPNAGMAISQVAISPTLACNLNCSYCYNYQESEPSRIRSLPSLSDVALEKIFTTLEELPLAKQIAFGFLGGEPLLHPSLLRKIVDRAKAWCETQDIAPGFLVTTNGINLAKPDIEDLIVKERFGVYISMDGPPAWHNEFRKTINGKGSFELVEAGVRRFFSYNPMRYRSVRATVKLLPGRILKTYNFLRDFGFNDIGWGSSDFESVDLKSIDQPAIFEEIEALARQFEDDILAGSIKRHSWFTEIFALLYKGESKGVICGATRNHVAFDVWGHMQACHRFLGNEQYVLSSKDIKLGSKSRYIAEIRDAGKTAHCDTCWAQGLCGGECFHVGKTIAQSVDHEKRQKFLCDFKRHKYQCAINAYMNIWKINPGLIAEMVGA
ncbi:radical SAM protein [Variovorax sp.]|uniref:radical SAM protein n=1 Tax=Variovorax sp. TaxID=1871043 RepID=UPI003BAD9794